MDIPFEGTSCFFLPILQHHFLPTSSLYIYIYNISSSPFKKNGNSRKHRSDETTNSTLKIFRDAPWSLKACGPFVAPLKIVTTSNSLWWKEWRLVALNGTLWGCWLHDVASVGCFQTPELGCMLIPILDRSWGIIFWSMWVYIKNSGTPFPGSASCS